MDDLLRPLLVGWLALAAGLIAADLHLIRIAIFDEGSWAAGDSPDAGGSGP